MADMWIAHLSDMHLRPRRAGEPRGCAPQPMFWQALDRIARLARQPDLLVLSGDLAESGELRTYRGLVRRLERLALPFCLVPGNHDDRARLQQAFPGNFANWEGRIGHVDLAGGRLLLLDTQVAGAEWGWVDADDVSRLLLRLEDRPGLLAMHHPPFPVGIPGMDRIACRGAVEMLGQALRGRLDGLLCGHVHRHVSTLFHGIPAQVAPSTAHQIAFDAPQLAYTFEPGGFLLHHWLPGQALLTHALPSRWQAAHPYPE